MNSARMLLRNMTLIGAMTMAIAPCFAQQEVDPTWYNPWPSASTKPVKSSQLKPASAPEAKTAIPVSSNQSKTQNAKRRSARVKSVAIKQ